MLKLKPSSLDWAMEHVNRFDDTSMLPLPFEYSAIKLLWPDIRSYVSEQDALNWKVRAHRSLLAPKGRYAFRIITQLDPLDFLVFAALIREIAKDVEAIRFQCHVMWCSLIGFRLRKTGNSLILWWATISFLPVAGSC